MEERQDALKSVLDLGHIPAGMEGFFAVDQEQFEYIKRIIEECDYYVLIVAGRYGSLDSSGISFTEREYDYAVSKGLNVLAFIHKNVDSLPSSNVDHDIDIKNKLVTFRKKIESRRLVSYWQSRDELKANVIISLTKAMSFAPGEGWLRGNSAASEDILLQLNEARNLISRITAENAQLKEQVQPSITDLADLASEFAIRCFYVDRGGAEVATKISLSWRKIFMLVGPSLFCPSSDRAIVDNLVAYVQQDRRGAAYVEIYTGDIDIIKLQLLAYGFITITAEPNNDGRALERLTLTAVGKMRLVEVAAIRSEP